MIEATGLTKGYGATLALDSLDLEVPAGAVFGYLGPNGAGKTTTIRLLLGLLRPTSGQATIHGHDTWRERNEVHRRVGYLPGDFYGYAALTATQYLRYLARLRGRADVDWDVVEVLAKRFHLDLDRRIATLSHGNRQKVGLIQAFMHEPDLVVLDEPTSGLDPLMQNEFLALVREARDAGRTVVLSSHALDEVEAVADMVGILREGRLVVVDEVANLRSRARRRLDLTFEGSVPAAALRQVAGVRDLGVDGRTARLTVDGSLSELLELAAPFGIENVSSHETDLEDIFLAYYEDR
ncbi:MAG: ABC transporter ATP-binding protein [Acidimicrobiia bacterium]|nr:ABC transporter ATP-binding protein [Acidimicrobiia bacterium]